MASEDGVILSLLFTKNIGAICSAKQTKDFNIYLTSNKGHILAFYRPSFRPQTVWVLAIELNEQDGLLYLIDVYTGIPATYFQHQRVSRSPFPAL